MSEIYKSNRDQLMRFIENDCGGDCENCEQCGGNPEGESEGKTMSEQEQERDHCSCIDCERDRERERQFYVNYKRDQERDRERERARIAGEGGECDCADCIQSNRARIERRQERYESDKLQWQAARAARIAAIEGGDHFTCAACNYSIASESEIADMRVMAMSGGAYHGACLDRAIICQDCGKICGYYDYYQARAGGDPLCADCINEKYHHCQLCGQYEDRAASGELVCAGIEICEDCLQSINVCEDCGELASDSYSDPESGDPLCRSCSREREQERERKRQAARIAAKIESGEYKKVKLADNITSDCEQEIVQLIKGEITRQYYDAAASGRALNFALAAVDYLAIIGGRELVNKRGKIAKRIKNNIRREHGITIDPAVVSEIGNIAANYSLLGGEHIIEITRDLIGTAGHFGDHNACFQAGGSYHHHLQAMDSTDQVLALRVYTSEGGKLARCWIFTGDNEGRAILFNSYGERLNKLADLYLASGESGGDCWHYIDLTSEIFINGNEGIMIGGNPESGDYDDYEIDIDPHYHERETCEHCGRQIREGGGVNWQAESVYCDSCFEDLFTLCDNCYQFYDDDNISEIERASGEYCQLCEDCLSELASDCEQCGELYITSEGGEDCEGDPICGDCIERIKQEGERERAAAILRAGGDYRHYCQYCRLIALRRRQASDPHWQETSGEYCEHACEKVSEIGDPRSILFVDCPVCNESGGGEYCADHYSLIMAAINERDRRRLLAKIASKRGQELRALRASFREGCNCEICQGQAARIAAIEQEQEQEIESGGEILPLLSIILSASGESESEIAAISEQARI